MPTSDPIVTLITRNVIATIETVRVQNGEALIVEPRRRAAQSPVDLLCVISQGSPSKIEDPAVAHDEWLQPYEIDCYVIDSENTTQPIDERINEIRSQIEKALMVDPTRGGFAISDPGTQILDPTIFDDVRAPISGITVRCAVYYRTLIDDPYSQ